MTMPVVQIVGVLVVVSRLFVAVDVRVRSSRGSLVRVIVVAVFVGVCVIVL